MKQVYVFWAEGFEDIEGLACVDILKRGGVAVATVSNTENRTVTTAHGIGIIADMTFSQFLSEYDSSKAGGNDILVFPGGMPGATNLASNEPLMQAMRSHLAAGGTLAAICAAPAVVLANLPDDVLNGCLMTCYPGFEPALETKGVKCTGYGVTVCGRIITANGPGHATAFGLAVLAAATSQETADKVASQMVI